MGDKPLKVTIDTNVIISALLFGGNSKQIIEKLIKREFEAYTSPQLISELIDTLIKKFNFSNEKMLKLQSAILDLFVVVYPSKSVNIVRDSDDNKVLEAAIESKSDLIISGDKDLLDLKLYGKIKIINPKDFIDQVSNKLKSGF